MLYKNKLLLVLFVLLVVIVACSPAPVAEQGIQTSVAVQIDEALKIAFSGLLLALFTAGFIYIFERTGLDLRGYALSLSVVISTYIVAEVQDWINGLPESQDPWIVLILRILGALLAGFGTLRIFNGSKSSGTGNSLLP